MRGFSDSKTFPGRFFLTHISRWRPIHTYIHTLYFHSNLQSSSVELIASSNKIIMKSKVIN